MYRAHGRYSEAIPLAEQVRDVRLTTLGAFHPDTIHSLDNLGLAYQAAGEVDKALTVFEQAGTGLQKLDFVHTEAGQIVGDLCDCLELKGNIDRADLWRQKWLAAVKNTEGPLSAGFADDLVEQGEDLLRRGRDSRAEPILRESVSILQKKQPDGWSKFRAQSLLGVALLGQKRWHAKTPQPTDLAGQNGSRRWRSGPKVVRHVGIAVDVSRVEARLSGPKWGRG